MSLTLTTNPVITEGGIFKNVFSGFGAVEFKFKREDLIVTSVGQGIDNQILITIGTDLSSYLNVGDSVYVYSEGDNYTYDEAGQVVAVTSTTITITGSFIEAATGGYINYLKNYYVECELVNVDNTDVKILPFNLKDDGDNAGNITIDVSIANDLNIQFFEFVRQEMEASRTIFNLQYREVYDVQADDTYTLITDDIILVYATQQPEQETLINELDVPKYWKGYPNGVIFVHSEENADNTGLYFTYDELDINQQDIVTDISLGGFVASDEGFLFINIDKDKSYNANTEYIKIKGEYQLVKFFSSDFFDPNFFDA